MILRRGDLPDNIAVVQCLSELEEWVVGVELWWRWDWVGESRGENSHEQAVANFEGEIRGRGWGLDESDEVMMIYCECDLR